MWGAGATMAAVTAYVEAYAAAATGAFVDAEARALAKDRDDAAAAVISRASARSSRRRAATPPAPRSPRSPRHRLRTRRRRPGKTEEFAAEVVEVVDAAGGAMLASKLPRRRAKYGRLDYKALGFASMSALAPRSATASASSTGRLARKPTSTIERRILEIVDGRPSAWSRFQRLYKDRRRP